jgi:hypothetical protein
MKGRNPLQPSSQLSPPRLSVAIVERHSLQGSPLKHFDAAAIFGSDRKQCYGQLLPRLLFRDRFAPEVVGDVLPRRVESGANCPQRLRSERYTIDEFFSSESLGADRKAPVGIRHRKHGSFGLRITHREGEQAGFCFEAPPMNYH